MNADLAALLYLTAGVLFVLALRGLSNPETSRRGDLFGMIGMAIAIVTTLAAHPPAGWGASVLVILGLAIGGTIGAVIARRVPMTSMPELVAAFHSLVRMAAVLRGSRHVLCTGRVRHRHARQYPRAGRAWSRSRSASRSAPSRSPVRSIAFLKLSGRMSGAPILLPAAVHRHGAGAGAGVCSSTGWWYRRASSTSGWSH